MAGFDEKCPYCGVRQDQLYAAYESADYSNPFFAECWRCGKRMRIDVHQVPEFETAKPLCPICNKTEVQGKEYCGPCLAAMKARAAR